MSSYPSSLDALRTDLTGADDAAVVDHAGLHNDANAAINAVEAELGTNPSGAAATVKDRLDAIDADARWTDQRTPTDGSVTNAKVATNAAISPSKIAGTAVVDNDPRLTNSRTPTAHKASHATGGGDALTPADIGAATAAQGTKADTAVQPARSIAAGTGLTGGGDLSADRTISIAAGGVGSVQIADGAVGTAKLADGSVTSAKIADGTIVNADIAVGAAIDISKISPQPADFGTIDVKGDMLAGLSDGVVGRVPVAVDGRTLITDSSQSVGVRWAGLGNLVPTNAASGTNLLGTTAGFTSTGSTIASTTDQAWRGARSLQVTATAAGATCRVFTGGTTTAGTLPVVGGAVHTLVLQARAAAGLSGRNLAGFLYWWRADGGAASTAFTLLPTTALSDSAWTQIVVTPVAPADAVAASVRISGGSNIAIGDVFYLDGVGFWAGYGGQHTVEGPVPNLGVLVTETDTSGRSCFVWDDRNQRAQMVYYDSGWRDVSPSLLNSWSGSVYLRRADNQVMVRLSGLSGAPATSDTLLVLPSGFRPEATIFAAVCGNTVPGDLTMAKASITSAGALAMNPRASVVSSSQTLIFSTTNPLQATLPGQPVGTIPNA